MYNLHVETSKYIPKIIVTKTRLHASQPSSPQCQTLYTFCHISWSYKPGTQFADMSKIQVKSMWNLWCRKC